MLTLIRVHRQNTCHTIQGAGVSITFNNLADTKTFQCQVYHNRSLLKGSNCFFVQ